MSCLVTVTGYDGCDVIGYFSIDIHQHDLVNLRKILENEDNILCISSYDQGEYRISGQLSDFRELLDPLPLDMHRTQMGHDYALTPLGTPELHLHKSNGEVWPVCIKNGHIKYRTPIESA